MQGDRSRRALDLGVERARADSITAPRHRARALAAMADGLLNRGDTTAAAGIWHTQLNETVAAASGPHGPIPVVRLVTIGDTAVTLPPR